MSKGGQSHPATIPELILWRVNSTPRLRAYGYRAGVRQWTELRWKESVERIHSIAHSLDDLGLKPGDRLAIVADTCLEWHLAELAAMMTGIIPVGIDHRLPAEQQRELVEDSDPAAILCQNSGTFASNTGATQRRLILLDDSNGPATYRHDVIRWTDFASEPTTDLPERHFRVSEHQPALWVYTSGTTGCPKAVEYTHRQLMIACRSIATAFNSLQTGDATLCWLPMAHLFQRMMNFVAIRLGVTTYFVQDPHTVVDCAREVHPSVFIGVPRFYEKLREGIDGQIAKSPRRIRQLAARVMSPTEPAKSLVSQVASPLVNQIVSKRLRAVLGRKMRILVTGSAPMEMSLLRYFEQLGWPILEAYGVTENTIPIATNRPECFRFGSVGKPLLGNELRLDAEGEILVRGEGVFHGYVGDARSPEDFTHDDFYRTGDLGYFDEDGFLFVLGRKDDVFKLSTGRRIIPSKVESSYVQSPFIERMIVFGKGKRCLVALIWPHMDNVRRQLKCDVAPSAESEGRGAIDVTVLRSLISAELRQYGQRLASYERVRRFAIPEQPLSVERNELTTTLKVRRSQVEVHFHRQLSDLYEHETTNGHDPSAVVNEAMAK